MQRPAQDMRGALLTLGSIDELVFQRYNEFVDLHIYFYEVNNVQNRFLRQRIGWLLCMLGAVLLLGAISYQELEIVQTGAMKTETTPTVLIIDPGHGGDDGGAVSDDGILEADLNLSIAERLEALAKLCGIQTLLTRTGSGINYPPGAETIAARKVADQKQRVELINAVPNAVLISIHQNQYPTAQPHGAQVLYAATAQSETFGTLMHDALTQKLDPENRRVAAPISDDIYLMKQITCPGVLVECGFLSNPEECKRLCSDAYQIQLSLTMLSSYLEYFQNGWNL